MDCGCLGGQPGSSYRLNLRVDEDKSVLQPTQPLLPTSHQGSEVPQHAILAKERPGQVGPQYLGGPPSGSDVSLTVPLVVEMLLLVTRKVVGDTHERLEHLVILCEGGDVWSTRTPSCLEVGVLKAEAGRSVRTVGVVVCECTGRQT